MNGQVSRDCTQELYIWPGFLKERRQEERTGSSSLNFFLVVLYCASEFLALNCITDLLQIVNDTWEHLSFRSTCVFVPFDKGFPCSHTELLP